MQNSKSRLYSVLNCFPVIETHLWATKVAHSRMGNARPRGRAAFLARPQSHRWRGACSIPTQFTHKGASLP